MKKCPYCAEEVQDDAIKCKHCASMLVKELQEKWYFKTSTMIIAFLCIGPLALPVIWFNPRFNQGKKILISSIVIFLSFFLVIWMLNSIKNITSYYKTILQ